MDIMLVDDNVEILQMLSTVFSAHNQSTVMFVNPLEARVDFDLVTSDSNTVIRSPINNGPG